MLHQLSVPVTNPHLSLSLFVCVCTAVTREEAAMILKYYRRLLLHSKWKLSYNSNSSGSGNSSDGAKCHPEMMEFFNVLYLLYTLAKAILYSYSSRGTDIGTAIGSGTGSGSGTDGSGSGEYLSYSALFSSLSPGTNSDTTNVFLVTLEGYVGLGVVVRVA